MNVGFRLYWWKENINKPWMDPAQNYILPDSLDQKKTILNKSGSDHEQGQSKK